MTRRADTGQRDTGQEATGQELAERGTAMVEVAIVSSLLFLLLFGVITFGMTLSYRQNMVRTANDAVRAGAVAPLDEAVERAVEAARVSAGAFGKTCEDDSDGLTCTSAVAPCPGAAAAQNCITVRVEHDYDADPIVAPLPFVSLFMPSTMSAEAIAIVGEP